MCVCSKYVCVWDKCVYVGCVCVCVGKSTWLVFYLGVLPTLTEVQGDARCGGAHLSCQNL